MATVHLTSSYYAQVRLEYNAYQAVVTLSCEYCVCFDEYTLSWPPIKLSVAARRVPRLNVFEAVNLDPARSRLTGIKNGFHRCRCWRPISAKPDELSKDVLKHFRF